MNLPFVELRAVVSQMVSHVGHTRIKHRNAFAALALVSLVLRAEGTSESAPKVRNLARDAMAATPHAPQRAASTANKAIDGVADDNSAHQWEPAVTAVSAERPVLL